MAVVAACGLGAFADDAPPFYVGGTQVHELDHDHWVDTLHRAGLNTVAVTVYAKQGAWDSGRLWFNDDEPAVVDEIRTAKRKGLAVVLVLRVAVDHADPGNRFIWHGMIMPSSSDAIDEWFDRYTEFVVKWAAISEAEGVDVLGIGSEMNALNATLPINRYGNLKNYYGYSWYQKISRRRVKRFASELEPKHLWIQGYDNYPNLAAFLDARLRHTMAWARQAYLRPGPHTLRRINARRRLIGRRWTGLIEQTRRVYGGKLTYAANFDSYRNVGFWSELDMIGINSYFPLRSHVNDEQEPEEKLELFKRGWESILGRISRFKKVQQIEHMAVMFTEVGYSFRRHSTVEPWAHAGFSILGWKGHKRQLLIWRDQPVDYDERRLALEALQTVHPDSGADLVGLLYWKLSTDSAHEAIEPFVVHVGPDSQDRTQEVLASFASR